MRNLGFGEFVVAVIKVLLSILVQYVSMHCAIVEYDNLYSVLSVRVHCGEYRSLHMRNLLFGDCH